MIRLKVGFPLTPALGEVPVTYLSRKCSMHFKVVLHPIEYGTAIVIPRYPEP